MSNDSLSRPRLPVGNTSRVGARGGLEAHGASAELIPAATIAAQRVAEVRDRPRRPAGPAPVVLRATAGAAAAAPPVPTRGAGVHGLAAAARPPQPARPRASGQPVVEGGERTTAARHLRGALARPRPPGSRVVAQRRAVGPLRPPAVARARGTWPTTSRSSGPTSTTATWPSARTGSSASSSTSSWSACCTPMPSSPRPGSHWPGSRRPPAGSAIRGGP